MNLNHEMLTAIHCADLLNRIEKALYDEDPHLKFRDYAYLALLVTELEQLDLKEAQAAKKLIHREWWCDQKETVLSYFSQVTAALIEMGLIAEEAAPSLTINFFDPFLNLEDLP